MRFKDICTLSPSYVGDMLDKEVSFVPMESLRNGEIDLKEIPFGEAKGKYTYFGSGDLLVAKVTPCFENGNIAIAEKLKEGVGFGSSEIFVLRMKESAYNRYMFYIVQSSKFQGEACSTMCGVGGLKRISPLFMKTYELDLPPLPVQHRIASYLDAKTGEIDGRVALLEQKLDAYARLKRSVINRAVTRGLNPNVPLKNSQVEWIGQIPQHWKSIHFKNCVTIFNGKDYKAIETEEGYPVVGSGGQFAWASNAMYEGEVIFLGRKGTIDKPLYYKGAFWAVDTMFYAVPSDNVVGKYMYYYSTIFPFKKISTATALPSMTQTDLYQLDIMLPPLSEQQAIADYLDAKCAEIDAAVANTQKQIEALKRLKRSLINEVVTGKRAV